MADITVWVSEDISEGEYFDFSVETNEFFDEMSDHEKEEMARLLMQDNNLNLEKADKFKSDRFTEELLSVFTEIAEMKHLPLLQIANEIREKYL